MDKVAWFELPADDMARAGKFYGDVFGWQTSDMGNGSLAAISTPVDDELNPLEPGAINGDISPRSEQFTHPIIVITVEDMDAKLKMVEEAGGTIVQAPVDTEGVNMRWALVADTEGNTVGIIQNL